MALGARRWLPLILVAWGAVAMSFAAMGSTAHFLALRLLLGLTESGAYPGGALWVEVRRGAWVELGGLHAEPASRSRLGTRPAPVPCPPLCPGMYYVLSLFYPEG